MILLTVFSNDYFELKHVWSSEKDKTNYYYEKLENQSKKSWHKKPPANPI